MTDRRTEHSGRDAHHPGRTRIFVTGGSGFVGGALIAALGPDHDMLAMARSDEAASSVEARGATPVRCDLEAVSPSDVVDCDVVVHCAAVTDEWAPAGTYERVNVAGTARMLEVARAAGVRRFVHISSDSALFDGSPMPSMTEDDPLATESPFGYARTKAVAESLVREANDTDAGFETIVVRPVLVWGPGDQTILPQIGEMVDRGAWVWLSGGRTKVSTTHISNLVHGIRLAIERGRPGSVYFVTDGAPHELRAFLGRYASAAGHRLPDRSVPAWIARLAARIIEPIWAVARPTSPPPLTRFAVASLSRDIVTHSSRARDELGYEPLVDFETGLAQVRANVDT